MSQELRIVVMGAGKTGKSALTIQFVQGHFWEGYEATVEDTYTKTAEVDGKACTLTILDTAGQEEYRSCVSVYLDRGDGFVIVYSVLDPNSFEEARNIYESLIRARKDLNRDAVQDGEFVPIVLVGNKVDLVSTEEKLVERRDAVETANDWRCKFYETSAKTRENVEPAFHDLIRAIKKAQRREEQRRAGVAAQEAQARQEPEAEHQPPRVRNESHPPKHSKSGKKKCAIL